MLFGTAHCIIGISQISNFGLRKTLLAKAGLTCQVRARLIAQQIERAINATKNSNPVECQA